MTGLWLKAGNLGAERNERSERKRQARFSAGFFIDLDFWKARKAKPPRSGPVRRSGGLFGILTRLNAHRLYIVPLQSLGSFRVHLCLVRRCETALAFVPVKKRRRTAQRTEPAPLQDRYVPKNGGNTLPRSGKWRKPLHARSWP
jgi:hypothetical protein